MDLQRLSLTDAAAALAGKEFSSRELCEAILARIDQVDTQIKAYLYVNTEEALCAADEADERRRAGQTLSPLDGLPIAVKDNLAVTGQPCTCASKMLADYVSPYDATVVRRLKDAGMIILGRTNMDEFAMGSSTENSAFTATSNPWNHDRVPGGSSGGSAAAVAAGEALAALGSDTGGSIRQPASFCGVVGLKPSYGRVSRYGLVAYASSLDQIGPITKNVRDSAMLLDLMAGRDPLDSTSLPTDAETATELGKLDLKKLRIGVPRQFFDVTGLADEVQARISNCTEKFRALGAEIVDVSLPHNDYVLAAYYIIATAEASANLARFDGIRYGLRSPEDEAENLLQTYRLSRAAGFGEEVKRRIILGTYVLSSGYYDAYYLRAQKVRTLIRNDFEKAFEQCDVILAPTAPATAFCKGSISSPLEMYLADIYTVSANLAGICGISVPCGFDKAELPIGLQILAPAMQEKLLLQTAFAFEQGTDIHEI